VVEAENLEVEESEVGAALDRILQPLSESKDAVRRALDTPAGRRRIRLDLLTDKAVARLVQIARGEAPALPEKGRDVVSAAEGPPSAAPGLPEGHRDGVSEAEGLPPAPAEVQAASQGEGLS
jgi:hypothetical protein